jgi:hypothetical protein
MSMTKRTVGQGIGQRDLFTVSASTPEEMRLIWKLVEEEEESNDLALVLGKVEAQAVSELTKAGLSPVGVPDAEGITPPDGPAGYAARILGRLGQLKGFRKSAEEAISEAYRRFVIDRACVEAMRLGGLLREEEIKREWNDDAVAGRGSREGARRGGGHNAKDERNIRAAMAYRQARQAPKNNRKSDSFLKELCGRAVGCKSRGAAIAAVDVGEKLLEDTPLI